MIGSVRIPTAWFGSYPIGVESEIVLTVRASVSDITPTHVTLALDWPRVSLDELRKLAEDPGSGVPCS